MSDWILIIIALIAGLVIGLIASRIVYALVGAPSRPEPLQQAAKPLASLALSVGLVGGLIVALGILQPESLNQLRDDAISFIPKVMTAAIILIVANVFSGFATAALGPTLARLPLQAQRQIGTVVKVTIVTLAALLAVSQIGINTDVVNLGVAAVFFGIAASLTLLVGLGGNGVAREVAATRAVKRMVSNGDTVRVGDVQGVVVAVHPTAVELTTGTGDIVLVPSSSLVNKTMSIERVDENAAAPKV